MTLLGVNIDHCATLRQARYRETPSGRGIIIEPDVLSCAKLAESGGADSITAHLREDRRHMTDPDLFCLRKNISTKLNMELACVPQMVEIALELKPDFVCLVPENRKEVTTEGGLNVIGRLDEISEAAEKFAERGIECSLFIDPDERQVEAAKKTGAPLVELHTGAYANSWGNLSAREFETKRLEKASKLASELGLKVNAGHGLNYENTGPLLDRCEFNELNIGHTIISRALLVGLKEAVSQMKSIIVKHSKSDGIRE